MKQILTTCMMLLSLVSYSQDTLCVMITLDEVIDFDFKTSKIINRFDHTGDFEIKVNENEVICLHLCDEKRRVREVTTTFSDGDHTHNVFNSEDNVIFSKKGWGDFVINISEARRKE